MTPKEIDEYIMRCPYFSGKYTIDRKIISGEYTHVGSCDLEFHYNKICPSEKCMCANTMGLGKDTNVDTISRQAAIDELKRISFSHWFECGEYLLEDTREIKIISSSKALEAIEALPPAQPEIIRCKDCKHWDKTWTNDWAKDYHYCPMVDGVRKVDFYCADAERRTDEAY